MNFLISCCEKQPIRKLSQRLRSYEKENRSLIPAGDKVPILKIGAVLCTCGIRCCLGEERSRKFSCCCGNDQVD